MNAKLAVLAGLIALFAVLSIFAQPQLRPVAATASGIALVPAAVGEYLPVNSWHTELRGDLVEEGAVFAPSAGAGDPVQLDFFRNGRKTHNGIGCFLNQGESLLNENIRTLQTASGQIQFDVALLRTEDTIRIVAATECSARGCSEQALPLEFSFAALSQGSIDYGVVPVSVTLMHPSGTTSESDTETLLEQELSKAISAIDLQPARRLAALQ
jgi:hypothetical protein